MWLNLASDEMTVPELTDYAKRYLVDRFSVLDGVARVRVGGQQIYAMRIWLDRKAMAARGLTANDVENALRSENVELPAGSIEFARPAFHGAHRAFLHVGGKIRKPCRAPRRRWVSHPACRYCSS